MKLIDSPSNPKVKEWRKLKIPKCRAQEGQFLIEGEHLVEEAFRSGAKVLELICETGSAPSPEFNLEGVAVFEVSERVRRAISETREPQPLAAVCAVPDAPLPALDSAKGLLLLDGIQDPGNVGTLIRTADAVGLDGVVLGPGTADPTNAKALRASAGSIFHLPVVEGEPGNLIAELKGAGVRVYGSAAHGLAYGEASKGERFALVVGNEGKGIEPSLLAACDGVLSVPIRGKAESLTVSAAAAVLLYHLTG